MRRDVLRLATLGLLLAFGFGLGLGCASILPRSPAYYAYFAPPDPDDAWSAKIAGWQSRERADPPEPVAAGPRSGDPADVGGFPGQPGAATVSETDAPGDDLRAKYRRFQADRKRALAREVADWIQQQARSHYVPDGPIDHWATLEETLRRDGDDCDGLELLVFYALRELGFPHQDVFRAIVYRPSDGQHHMVTLWFEDRSDPWVIDPTGAMTTGMPRMSSLPEWVPLKIFSDTEEYSVHREPERIDSTSRLAAMPMPMP